MMMKRKMKGITPIISIIILLLITIALAGAAYTYLSIYFQGSTAKTIQLADAFCNSYNTTHSNVTIILSNVGTQSLTISGGNGCGPRPTTPELGVAPCPVGFVSCANTSQACNDISVIKISGGNFVNAYFKDTSIVRNGNTNFLDTCAPGATCEYRFLVAGTAIGATTASVRC